MDNIVTALSHCLLLPFPEYLVMWVLCELVPAVYLALQQPYMHECT